MRTPSADETIPTPALRPAQFGLVATTHELRDPSTLREIEEALGPLWTVRTYPSYASLVDALGSAHVDLAWLPPMAYVRAAAARSADLVLTLERMNTPSYASAILVRDSAAVSGLDYVRGKRAVWVDAWSAAGYLMPRRILRAAGVDPDRAFASQQFVGSHSAVIDAVSRGVAHVGAAFCSVDARGEIVRSAWSPEHHLRPIALSEPIPGDTICASPKLGMREGRALAARLITLAAAGSNRELLLRTFGADRFIPGNPARYVTLGEALADEMAREPSR